MGDKHFEAVVVGGGPVGFAAAIGLASHGIETAIVAAPEAREDRRTSALLAGSVAFLTHIGVWQRLAPQAASPLKAIRIVDDTGRLLRAPEATFHASEIGLEAFGWSVANRDLVPAMRARAAEEPRLTLVNGRVVEIGLGDAARVKLVLGAEIGARLVVGADGRDSAVRRAAGIGLNRWSYDQTALVADFAHTRPHHGVSTEFHGASGPFTLVPIGPERSGIVWVERPARAEELLRSSEAEFCREAERRSHGLVGRISLDGPRQSFRLSGGVAERFGASRAVLVGEAAHVVPPIGAQGLNLGLRDAAALVEIAAKTRARGDDFGGEGLTAAYDAARRGDVWSRAIAVDLLNRSLLTGFLPVQAGRAFVLNMLERFGPLRRLAMREGVAPLLATPKLARPQPRAGGPR